MAKRAPIVVSYEIDPDVFAAMLGSGHARMTIGIPDNTPRQYNKRMNGGDEAPKLLEGPKQKRKTSSKFDKNSGPAILRTLFIESNGAVVTAMQMREAFKANGRREASYSAQLAGMKSEGYVAPASKVPGEWKVTAKGLAKFKQMEAELAAS